MLFRRYTFALVLISGSGSFAVACSDAPDVVQPLPAGSGAAGKGGAAAAGKGGAASGGKGGKGGKAGSSGGGSSDDAGVDLADAAVDAEAK
jgi:hypothetical protein